MYELFIILSIFTFFHNTLEIVNTYTYIYIKVYISFNIYIKPLKSEAIHETGFLGNVVASFFPLIIFILLCFKVLSTVLRENRLADFLIYKSLYVYIYI